MFSSFILPAITFLFMFCACTKPPITYYVPDDIKEWAVFQSGSYWIYQYDTIQDSVVIDEYLDTVVYMEIQNTYMFGSNDKYYRQIIYMTYFSSQNSVVSDDVLNTDDGIKVYRLSYGLFKYDLSHVIMMKRFDAFKPGFGYASGNMRYISDIDIFTVNGKEYYDVKHLQYDITPKDSTFYSGYDQMNYYLAKNYGVIKKVFTNNTDTITWDLVKYNIIQ